MKYGLSSVRAAPRHPDFPVVVVVVVPVLKGFPDLRTFGSSVVHSLDVVHLDSILPKLCPIESIPLSRPRARAGAYCFSVIPPRIPSVGLELGNYFCGILHSLVPLPFGICPFCPLAWSASYSSSCLPSCANSPLSILAFRTSHRKSIHCSFLPSAVVVAVIVTQA